MTRLPAAALMGLVLAGCGVTPKERVVLLPNEDGHASAVVITRRDGRTVELNQPYASVQVSPQALTIKNTSAEAVQSRYAQLLAVQPPKVRSYTLYFEFNRTVLTQESQREVALILTEATLVPAAEIDVIGHTDRRGSVEFNDALGRSRAQFVAGLMESRGFARSRLSVQSRGEREPLIATPDEVEEPRNRRVEIRLR